MCLYDMQVVQQVLSQGGMYRVRRTAYAVSFKGGGRKLISMIAINQAF